MNVIIDHTDDETADASYVPYQEDAGTDLTIAASKAVEFRAPPAWAMRLESSGAEAADRRFRLYGIRI